MFGFGACDKQGGAGFGHGFGHGFGMHPFMQHGMFGRGGCGGPAALIKELGLSDQQLERVAELKIEGLGQCAQIKLEFGKLIKGLLSELTQESINKDKIRGIAQQIKAEKQKFGESMIERLISLAEVLTPEQRKKLKLAAIKKFLGVDLGEGLEQ